jgi:DNA gyrase/topoisomerase IV subunit B
MCAYTEVQLELTQHAKTAQEFSQSFERGLPIGDMQQRRLPPNEGKVSGTTVRFLFDKSVFTPG